MLIAVPRETTPGETRVAMTPDAARRVVDEQRELRLESGAGERAGFDDAAYRDAGVEVADGPRALHEGADVVLRVRPPRPLDEGHEADLLPDGSVLVGLLDPHGSADLFRRLADRNVTAYSLELLPRITRAQRMDALSAMSTVAGYKAALIAADSLDKFFPMLMTAAGTVSPAKVFVLGAGVAGLQAIATCRRLGAEVEAFDIRPEVAEQVESLGADFVHLEEEGEELAGAGGGEGGYAGELSDEEQAREREMIGRHVAGADVVITTAQVPGGKAPTLVTAEMVGDMRPGSVIVDLAGESGGNCELTRPGETVREHGVAIRAPANLPASLPVHASQMYARNLTSFLDHIAPEGRVEIDLEDEIQEACCVTHDGDVRFEP
mgnify:CR=1 FL=1